MLKMLCRSLAVAVLCVCVQAATVDVPKWVDTGHTVITSATPAEVSAFVGSAGSLQLGTSATTLGTLALAGNTSGLVTMRPAAAAGTWTFTLPTHGGTSGYFLQTNGSGTCTWAAGGAGTVTSVSTGDGLQGGAITSSGTIDLRLNASGGLSKTLGVGSNELGIAAGGIVNAMISASAAIAGTKIASNFGAQDISTSGTIQLVGDWTSVIANTGVNLGPVTTPDILASNILAAAGSDANKTLVLQSRPTQSGNLLECQDSTGADIAHITATGTFFGNGSALTSLDGAHLQVGTVVDSALSANVPLKSTSNAFTNQNSITFSGGCPLVVECDGMNLAQLWQTAGGQIAQIDGAGNVTATSFIGALNANVVNSSDGAVYPTWVVSSGIQNLNISNAYTFNPNDGTLSATSFAGDGASLTNINSSVSHLTVDTSLDLTGFNLHNATNITLNQNNTPPSSGNAGFYGDTFGEVWVQNTSNTQTQISPHAPDAPAEIYDQAPGIEIVIKSKNDFLGQIEWTNNTRMARKMDGEKLGKCHIVEPYASYNARTGKNLTVKDWATEQAALAKKSTDKIADQSKRKADAVAKKKKWTEAEIKPFIPSAKPAFVK